MSDNERITIEKMEKFIYNNNVSNEFLVQFIELCGNYLNLMTISEYAKKSKLSYNGVKKHRNVISLFKCKYVIDND